MTTLRVDEQNLAGEVLHLDRDGRVAYLLMATPGPEDEKSIRRRAHQVAMRLDSGEPLFDGAHVVETFQMPTTQAFYGHVLPGGAWVVGLKFSDETWPRISAQLDDGDTLNIAHKGGGDGMDLFSAAVRERRESVVRARQHETTKASFSDTVRATVPQGTHEVTDAELTLIRQTVAEVLKPLLFQVRELDRRITRIVTGLGQPPDRDLVFGQAVRHPETLTAAEKADAAKREAGDPFAFEVRRKREPLSLGQGHRFLRDKRRP